jgi:hypothetical protein
VALGTILMSLNLIRRSVKRMIFDAKHRFASLAEIVDDLGWRNKVIELMLKVGLET